MTHDANSSLMKVMLCIALASVSLMPGQVAPKAQPASQNNAKLFSRLIQCQVECIEVSHEDMTRLLFLRNQSLSDATPLRKELHLMIAGKKAKLVDTMILVAVSGQKAASESLMEYLFECEYEYDMPHSSKQQRVNRFSGTPDPAMDQLAMMHLQPPVSFEPRYVGGALEIEPLLNPDNNLIDLWFRWEITDHHGEKAWLNYKDRNNNSHKMQKPIFYTKRIYTSISCTPSTYTLVSVVDPQNEKGRRDPSRKWLIFAKCEVQSGR